MTTPILGIDYKYRDDLSKKYDTVPIELFLDPYKGVIVRYTSLSVKEIPEEGNAKIIFEYDIISLGTFRKKKKLVTKNFEKVLGDVLHSMIELSLSIPTNEGDEYKEELNENRAVDSEKLD